MTAVHVPEWEPQFQRAVRRAHELGPQVVVENGDEVAVVLDMAEYRRLTGQPPNFKDFLMSMPPTDDLDIDRSNEPARHIELGE